MTTDCGRADVYSAEASAFDGTDLESVRPLQQIVETIEEVIGGAWWPGGSVRVAAARSDARSSSARRVEGHDTVIRLAADQLTLATAAHELAHALAGPAAGHAPVFLAAYLDVIAVITNLDTSDRRRRLHVEQLRDAFVRADLEIGPRRWPPPPETAGGAIAL